MENSAFLSFLFFTIAVALISWLKTRKNRTNTTSSLFFGNRTNRYLVVGGALFLSNISANQFIGENESVYINNMTVIAWGITSVLAMLIVSEYFIPIYFKSRIATIPDFLEQRYDLQTKKLVSYIFLLSYVTNLLPTVLYGGAVAFIGMFNTSSFFGVTYWQSIWIVVWLIGVIGTLYSVLGGLKAITISDSVLGACMLIIGLLLPYYGLKYIGDGNIINGLDTILSSEKEHLNAIGTATDAIPFSTIFTGMFIINLYYWGMEQYIVQQVLASKSLADSQKGIALACGAKLLSPLLINVPGLIAVHIYPQLDNTATVFPLVVQDTLPSVLIGLTASIVLGAAITTYNAGLNSSSTLFVLNMYKPWQEKRKGSVSEKELVRTGKLFEIVVSAVAMLVAPFIVFASEGFYTYIQQVSGMFSIPIFTIIFIGFITRKVPPLSAKIGVIFFIISYFLIEFIFPVKLHYLHLLAILFILTSLFMLLIGRLYPFQKTFIPYDNSPIPLQPWKYRHISSVVLLILMIFIMILFSPLMLAS